MAPESGTFVMGPSSWCPLAAQYLSASERSLRPSREVECFPWILTCQWGFLYIALTGGIRLTWLCQQDSNSIWGRNEPFWAPLCCWVRAWETPYLGFLLLGEVIRCPATMFLLQSWESSASLFSSSHLSRFSFCCLLHYFIIVLIQNYYTYQGGTRRNESALLSRQEVKIQYFKKLLSAQLPQKWKTQTLS